MAATSGATTQNSNVVIKLRASDGALIGTFIVGTQPEGIASDGANILVTNSGSNNVTKLRARDGATLGTFGVGGAPSGVAFDGINIWVANASGSTVTKLRASDGAPARHVWRGRHAIGRRLRWCRRLGYE